MNKAQVQVRFDLGEVTPDLFDKKAEEIAKTWAEEQRRSGDKKVNKPTQLRRFFDEVVNWHQQISAAKTKQEKCKKYNDCLPLIKMLNAKVAYAEARELVGSEFRQFINDAVRQLEVDEPDRLKHFRLLFEAVMGFYKGMAKDK
jgi:CRISPR-associated protein Csm2